MYTLHRNRSGKMKLGAAGIVAIVAVAALVFFNWSQIQAMLAQQGINLPSLAGVQLNLLNYEGPPSGPVAATKKIAFNVIDDFAGSLLATEYIDVCDENGVVLETVTTSSGEGTTADAYRTGQVLHLRYRDAAIASATSAFWVEFTVPGFQNEGDVEANTNFDITLRSREYTAETQELYYANTNMNQGTECNKTSGGTPGTQSFILTSRIIEGTDNKGLNPSGYDVINKMAWKTVVYLKVEKGTDDVMSFNIYGWDGGLVSGNDKWYWKVIDEDLLSKWKVGNDYELRGELDLSISVDMGSGSDPFPTGDGRLELWLVTRTDPAYFQSHGLNENNFGPHSKNIISGTVDYWTIES